jgi:hypothetical protein
MEVKTVKTPNKASWPDLIGESDREKGRDRPLYE